MLKRRMAYWAILLLGAVAFGSLVGSGCAIHRGDRNTVQPLALDKKQFTGDWYYQKTLIETPYDAVGVFPGAQSDGFKVRWEITERFLYAYTTQPTVRNADSTVAPVAAWPITSHFTIRYRINYSTGQPSNVVAEDRIDKPWYERPHFRVAWEQSVITDYTSLMDWYYRIIGYIISERATNVRPEEVQITNDYMDIVNEEIVSPGIYPLIGKLNTGMPISAYRIRYRHSFLKVKPSTYTPELMTDDQFTKFGYFRTPIINYHPDRGLVDWSYKYLVNRHNVATAEEIKAGSKKPRQIIYYLSPNFPANMRATASLIADDWNRAFQRALSRPGEDIFVLRENGHGLPKGQERNMGDLRYNFLYWVPEAISFGLLGYGPSFADPDTGEIIASAAYVYGAVVRRVTDRFLLYYDMVSGRYSDEDLRNGKDYLDIINNFNGSSSQPLTKAEDGVDIKKPAYQGFDIQKAIDYTKSPAFFDRTRKLERLDRATIQGRLSLIDSKPSLKWAMMPDEVMQSYFPRTNLEQLRAGQDDDIKTVLDSYMNPGNWMRADSMRKLMQTHNEYGVRCVMMESYVDPALSKFVEANKHRPRAEIATLVEKMIFRGTEAHEIGHTLGLRHNFTASADEANYFPQYFDLKKRQGGNIPGEDNHPEHRWFYMYSSIMDYHGEEYGHSAGIGSYDHAAIMYAYGRIMELDDKLAAQSRQDLQEYLDKVVAEAKNLENKYKGIYKSLKISTPGTLQTFQAEAFDVTKKATLFKLDQELLRVEGIDADGKAHTILRLTADDLSGEQTMRDVHSIIGVAPKRARFYADGTPYIQPNMLPLQRRYYRFCSDELVGQDPYCTRFDSGSNPKEMIENMIRHHDGTYPLRNWSRGQRYYRLGSGYLYRLINSFSLVSLFYQNWIWRVVNEQGFQGSAEYFDQLAAIQRGVAFTSRVIHTPEPGRHVYDADLKAYVASSKESADLLNIPTGVGRYLYSKLQQDELGMAFYRFERIGTLYDKYVALMTLAIRDWGLAQNSLNFFYVNFADYFSSDDVTDIFTEAISGIFNKHFSMTYKDKMLQPNWHPVLQYTSMYMAVSMLNSGFYGNTFSHYMTVGVSGSGDSWTPPPGKEDRVISFSNTSGTRNYFAVQTEDGRSISFKLVEQGKKIAERIQQLRALSSSAINEAELRDKEAQLVWIETVLQMMKAYLSVFFED